jgi:hypothetical protein
MGSVPSYSAHRPSFSFCRSPHSAPLSSFVRGDALRHTFAGQFSGDDHPAGMAAASRPFLMCGMELSLTLIQAGEKADEGSSLPGSLSSPSPCRAESGVGSIDVGCLRRSRWCSQEWGYWGKDLDTRPTLSQPATAAGVGSTGPSLFFFDSTGPSLDAEITMASTTVALYAWGA